MRVGAAPGLARVSPDGSTVVVSNRGDDTVSLIDAAQLKVRSTIPVCQQPEDIAILPDSSKAFVACTGSAQVASIDLKTDKLLALLDVGKTPVDLALKPDGGELMVSQLRFRQYFDYRDIDQRSGRQLPDRHASGAGPGDQRQFAALCQQLRLEYDRGL